MIDNKELVSVGKFLKTHALKGELNAVLDFDAESLDISFPLIIEIDGIPVPFFSESIRTKGQFGCLIKLDGINSADEAKLFVNQTIYLLKTHLQEITNESEDGEYADDLIGYTIREVDNGLLGIIEDIDLSTQNALFIVNQNNKTLYIPVADEFIIDINYDQKTILMSLPHGLIDLN